MANLLPQDASADQTVADASVIEAAVQADAAIDGARATDAAFDAADAAAVAACVPFDAGVLDSTAVEAGALLALSLTPTCAYCHGTDYRGNLAVTAGAYSKNITPDPATGIGCWTDAELVQAILFGITPDGGQLCVMPQWSTRGLDAGQAEEIVQYLRSQPPIVNQALPTVCDDVDMDGGDASFDAADARDPSNDAAQD